MNDDKLESGVASSPLLTAEQRRISNPLGIDNQFHEFTKFAEEHELLCELDDEGYEYLLPASQLARDAYQVAWDKACELAASKTAEILKERDALNENLELTQNDYFNVRRELAVATAELQSAQQTIRDLTKQLEICEKYSGEEFWEKSGFTQKREKEFADALRDRDLTIQRLQEALQEASSHLERSMTTSNPSREMEHRRAAQDVLINLESIKISRPARRINTDVRVDFEKWATDATCDRYDLERMTKNPKFYRHWKTQHAWQGYEARALASDTQQTQAGDKKEGQ